MRLELLRFLVSLLVFNHIFCLLQRKYLAKIIDYTINFYNFRHWKHSGNRFNVILGTINLELLLYALN